MKDIHYSDGSTVPSVIVIWEDLHTERTGMVRAFWAASPDATSGSPIIGYASPGGSHKTVRACAAEARRLFPGETIYRNGRAVKTTDGRQ